MFDLSAAADTAAERLKASSDKSQLSFFRITEAVVRGTGVSNYNDVNRLVKELRSELRRRSAVKRRADAAAKRAAQKAAS